MRIAVARATGNIGARTGRYVDVAGPEKQDLVDMTRRTKSVPGRKVKLVPACSVGGRQRVASRREPPTTVDQWRLARDRRNDVESEPH